MTSSPLIRLPDFDPACFVSYAGDEELKKPWTYHVTLIVQLFWPFDNYTENHISSTN
jgi:hypothetical protein